MIEKAVSTETAFSVVVSQTLLGTMKQKVSGQLYG
ncbi:hypothetical protein OR1_01024 [Geobacter sp. OR-1]|nr:hypothetical protein OR1_01024 [Geobacter sp. OR-1]